MGKINHVFRRGAVYWWRRRLPVVAGRSGVLQLSLGTREVRVAGQISAAVTMASDEVMRQMADGGLSAAQAKAWLAHVVREQHERLRRLSLAEMSDGAPGAWDENRQADLGAGHAYRLLAERGASADVTEADRATLVDEGLTAAGLRTLDVSLQLYRADFFGSDARIARLRNGLSEVLGLERPSSMEISHAIRLVLEGRAGACLHWASTGRGSLSGKALVAQVAEILGQGEQPEDSHIPGTRSPEHDGRTQRTQAACEGMDPEEDAIEAVLTRLVARKHGEGIERETTAQIARTVRLFAEATGVAQVSAIRQTHLSRFRHVMDHLPPNYRKARSERDMPISEILSAARTEGRPTGLSVSTINRNLTILSQFLRFARGEGHPLDAALDTTLLTARVTRRRRDARPAFTADEVQQIFRHPVFTGMQSRKAWMEPGTLIEQDGLYWVLAIAALTGARRAEIAGLACADLREIEGVMCFRFRDTETRRVKTASSTRDVPVHPHLLDLGLLEHRDRQVAQGAPQLFPDMRPSGTTGKWGDPIKRRWSVIRTQQLGAAAEGKVLHSFRHYVSDQFKHVQRLPKDLRDDILGHTGKDVSSEVYGSASPIADRAAAIAALPVIIRREPE